ncbi:ABC transporter ATP-binding protein [Rhodospirillum sp. A1_3_36]|uniref:ABC transporter ATP-binding protein n=1 Tax=Rhodospirillum sp. A1_3_36 TaxID=3391666 RepID=UPI0039A5220A
MNGITRRYGDVVALSGLDFEVPGDRYIVLLGASGAGKTTLLRVIAGFEEPDAGQVLLDGQRLDGVPIHQRDVGFVFQNFALFPHLTVTDNVAYGLRHRAERRMTDPAEVTRRVKDMLDLVGLTGLGNRGIGAISGGQRQRVALARTLVTEPRIVLLDEPLGALDANLRDRMCEELRAIRQRLGITFLHVTGSETEALTMGDEVAVLSGGRIAQCAKPTELFARPVSAESARHLNAWNIFPGRVRDGVLSTGAGPLPMPRPLAEGSQAEMAIRFDQIGVCLPGQAPGGQDHFTARYIAGEFNGSTALAFFRADDGGLVQVVDHLGAPRLPDLREGEEYALYFPPTEALLFEKTPS